MESKPIAQFENPNYVYGNGPEVYSEDHEKGLILSANRSIYYQGWISDINAKSDNILPKRPKKSRLANRVTLELIKAGGIDALFADSTPSVIGMLFDEYTKQKVINAAYPMWKHVSEIVKKHYHQKAARKVANDMGGKPYTFDILLSPEFGKEIIKNGGCPYLFQRLEKKLNRALIRRPAMWLMLEAVKKEPNLTNIHTGRVVLRGKISTRRGQLHAHGTIVLKNKLEKDICKKVIRELNASENRKFENHEHRSEPIERNDNPQLDDYKRVDYCNKHRLLNKMFLNGLKSYSRTKELGSIAQQLYEIDRSRLKTSKRLITN